MRAQKRSALVAALVTVLMGVLASAAGAVVVHSSSGQFFGVALRQNASPESLAGLQVPAPTGATPLASNGNVDYNGGPILHSTAPYLIFWDPASKIPAASEALMSKYLTDLAHDSGRSGNVFPVLRQYTDGSGFANYSQTFTSTHAIVDTQAYPTTNRCPATSTAYPVCITDAQIQAELTRLIAARGLPKGIGAKAPMYAVITPQNVNVCFDAGGSTCGDNAFCAYHSNFVDSGQQVVYSIDPFIVWALDHTKGCQTDGTTKYQTPNAEGDHAYQINDNMSHEMSETITDPLGTGWWNTYQGNGQEVGDICATYGKPSDPLGGTSELAYAPTLGGTASAGSLFDQIVNSDDYYNQTEWSNGDVNCKTKNTPTQLVAAFTDTGSLTAGSSISFNPSTSSSSRGYSSVSWSFGDGKTAFRRGAPLTVSHAFATAGTYKVVLTLVDTVGNIKQVTKTLTIAS